MVGDSTYLGYYGAPEKISSSFTLLLLKLAILASDRVTKHLDLVGRMTSIQGDAKTAQRDFHKEYEPNWRICRFFRVIIVRFR